METVIGFVAGYLVGVSEGKGGLQRLRSSINAIVSSPQARRMLAEAMSAAEPVVRRASRAGLGSLGGVGGTVVREIFSQAVTPREESRAA